MSEYIEIDSEMSDDGTQVTVYTNLTLAVDGDEVYPTREAMEEGSAVAQALSVVEGIEDLTLGRDTLIVTLTPDAAWHGVVEDISAVLKDFFL